VQIKASSFEEDLDQSHFTPADYAIATAREKAKHVASEASDAKLVIAADTVWYPQRCHLLFPWHPVTAVFCCTCSTIHPSQAYTIIDLYFSVKVAAE
jgi:hypothetical protein